MAKRNRQEKRAGKRNKKQVVQDRWEKKQELGRQQQMNQDKIDRYVKPPVTARNEKQKQFLKALREKQCIVFVGSAGTGKSFCAASEATDWIKKGHYDKLILSRPAVGMGNSIGLLKGGLVEKYTPFLLPIIDVITQRYGHGFFENSMNNGTIEMLPLEYVRGRSIDQIVIVDEAQNLTPDEMYTILTRIADGGKAILLGDPAQHDLKGENGLDWLKKFTADNPELEEHVEVIEAGSEYIERGGLCKKVVQAKERSLGILPSQVAHKPLRHEKLLEGVNLLVEAANIEVNSEGKYRLAEELDMNYEDFFNFVECDIQDMIAEGYPAGDLLEEYSRPELRAICSYIHNRAYFV